jgi:hypothetical protein
MSDDAVLEREDQAACGSPDALAERLVGALETYLKTIQEIGRAQLEVQAAPYQDYLRALTEAQGSPDAAERVQAAYLEQSHRVIDQLGEGAGEATGKARGAYDDYVRSVAEALAGGSAEQLPPPVLAGLGHHFLLVAQWGAATEAAYAGGSSHGAR